jgi:hypothetical protein
LLDRRGGLFFNFRHGYSVAGEMAPHQLLDALINRAGMCLFLGYAERGQQLKDFVRGNLQLSRQLVDADLAHIWKIAVPSQRRT